MTWDWRENWEWEPLPADLLRQYERQGKVRGWAVRSPEHAVNVPCLADAELEQRRTCLAVVAGYSGMPVVCGGWKVPNPADPYR